MHRLCDLLDDVVKFSRALPEMIADVDDAKKVACRFGVEIVPQIHGDIEYNRLALVPRSHLPADRPNQHGGNKYRQSRMVLMGSRKERLHRKDTLNNIEPSLRFLAALYLIGRNPFCFVGSCLGIIIFLKTVLAFLGGAGVIIQ